MSRTSPDHDPRNMATLPPETDAVPASAVFAGGGTRRAAALAGVPMGQAYATWSQRRLFDACELFFRLGVRNLFVPLVRPRNMAETGHFRDHMLDWLRWGLLGADALQVFHANDWRVRLIYAGTLSTDIRAMQHTLDAQTGHAQGPRLFFTVTTSIAELWDWHRRMFLQGIATYAAAIRELYGEELEPVRLLVSFGKPFVGPDLLPPLLSEEVQCYWRQRPGYDITEDELRAILFDYGFLRRTWQADKTGRADEAIRDRGMWEHGPTLGLGIRRGSFWYPAAWAASFPQQPE
jgi:hypothetical protein